MLPIFNLGNALFGGGRLPAAGAAASTFMQRGLQGSMFDKAAMAAPTVAAPMTAGQQFGGFLSALADAAPTPQAPAMAPMGGNSAPGLAEMLAEMQKRQMTQGHTPMNWGMPFGPMQGR